MSFTFGLFTQVSGSGPLGPLVLKNALTLSHTHSHTHTHTNEEPHYRDGSPGKGGNFETGYDRRRALRTQNKCTDLAADAFAKQFYFQIQARDTTYIVCILRF